MAHLTPLAQAGMNLPIWKFIEGRWVDFPHVADLESVYMDKFKILMLNVWFGQFKRRERTSHQVQLFQQINPDFICLQEGRVLLKIRQSTNDICLTRRYTVTKEYLDDLTSHEWIRDNYFSSNGIYRDFYGVFLLSKIRPMSVKLVALPSGMGRHLEVGTFRINNKTVSRQVSSEILFPQNDLAKP